VLCLKKKHGKLKSKGKNCTSAKFDIVSQHPIDRAKGHGPTYHATNPDDVGPGDMGRIKDTMRAAERLHTVSKHPRHRQLWVTEFWRGSNPPDPTGVPWPKQAKWIEQGFYEFWKAGVSVAIYQGLVDNTGAGPNVSVGLFTSNFEAKPAWTAFRFPFVATRKSKKEIKVWGKAPASGQLKIQRFGHGRWSTIKTVSVHRNAVFLKSLRIRGKSKLRAQVGSLTSLAWTQK
jgi:hypothetical protein